MKAGSGDVGGLTLTQEAQPTGTTTLFEAYVTPNFGNQKARLTLSGAGTVPGGNPGNGWWTITLPRPVRSWTMQWDNALQRVTFRVYASSNWTGTPAMSMVGTPVMTAGNRLLGLNIGARLTSEYLQHKVVIGSVALDAGSGFVAFSTGNQTFDAALTGAGGYNNYHGLTGTLADFTLRGTTQFDSFATTSDSYRMFISGIQGPQGSGGSGGGSPKIAGWTQIDP